MINRLPRLYPGAAVIAGAAGGFIGGWFKLGRQVTWPPRAVDRIPEMVRSVFGPGQVGLDIPDDGIFEYKTAVKAGNLLVVAHGSRQEAERAKDIFVHAGLVTPSMHPPAAS